MSNKHFIGKRLFSFSDNGQRDPVSRVTLLVDDENAVTAGDDTGFELVANCPYADETLAQTLLNTVRGYQYRAFEAQSAALDPAAELGDGITAERVYSILAGLTDNGDGYPNISAPGDREEEDEYPEGGPMTQLFNRKLATTRTLISKNSESIRLLVERTDGIGEQFASIDVALDEIALTVSGINRDVTSLELRADGLEASVSSVQTGLSQTVRLASDGLTITNAAGSKLTIDGGQINAENLNLTGRIQFTDLTSSVQGDIDEAWGMAYNAQNVAENAVDAVGEITYSYNGKTYIDEDRIMAGTVIAGKLQGGSVGLLDGNGTEFGTITMKSGTTYALDIASKTSLRMQPGLGFNTFIGNNDGPYLFLTGSPYIPGDAKCKLKNGALVIGSESYGRGNPPNTGYEEAGQLYFKLA